MSSPNIVRVPTLKTAEAFGAHLKTLGVDLGFENNISSGEASALTKPIPFRDRAIGNRWAVHPMDVF